MSEEKAKPKQRRWLIRVARLLFFCTGFLIVVASGAVIFLVDRPVTVPQPLVERVQERVEQTLNGLGLEVGQVRVAVLEGWRPVIELQDVQLFDPGGQELVAFRVARAELAGNALLNGQVQALTIQLSGAVGKLQRDMQGRMRLSASLQSDAVLQEAASLPGLINALDRILVLPAFAQLQTVDADAVTLQFDDLRADRSWTVDGARLRLVREESDLRLSADLALLSGGAGVATMEANYSSQIGAVQSEFGVSFEDLAAIDLAASSPALSWLATLRAPISGAMRGGVDDAGAFTPLSATLQIGQGVLQPSEETRPIPFQSARTYFALDPKTNVLRFDELALESDWVTGRGSGEAELFGLSDGQLTHMVAQFSLTGLVLNPPGLYEAPIDVESADLDMRLRLDPFVIDVGEFRATQGERRAFATGQISAQNEGWRVAIDAHMPQTDEAQVLALWPKTVAPNTRRWIAQNLVAAQIQGLDFALRTKPGAAPDTYLGFQFADTEMTVLPEVPAIFGALGSAELLSNQFAVTLSQGHMRAPQGQLANLSGSSFIIPDVTQKGRVPAQVRVNVSADLPDLLRLLNLPPIELLKDTDLAADVAQGQVVAQAKLDLDLGKKELRRQTRFEAAAKVVQLTSAELVPDRQLSADAVFVKADNDRVEISGDVRLNGVPGRALWWQDLGQGGDGSSNIRVDFDLSEQSAKALGLVLPIGQMRGQTPVRVDMSLSPDMAPSFSAASSLEGLSMSIPELGWRKSASRSGELRLAGSLSPPVRIDRLFLRAPGFLVEGRVDLTESGGLREARLSTLRVYDWLNATLRIKGRGARRAPQIAILGGRLDLRKAAFGGSTGGSSSAGSDAPLSVVLERLQITDTIALTNMTGLFDLSGGLRGRFSGLVNGRAEVSGTVQPKGGRSSFNITSNDGGAVFAAADFLEKARGGQMQLTLDPVGTAGGFNGALHIKGTRVIDAPAFAALLNALSVVGLLEQMKGAGLHFSSVDAAFRLTPDRVTLTHASAIGPSMGLSVEGIYHVNETVLDMQGVFSPFYLVNGVGAVVTGRGEGIVGINFRIKGTADDPKIKVNPLSILTPSIFREIFRRPPPKLTLEPGEAAGGNSPEVLEQPKRPRRERREREEIER